jgi:cell division protease FtsH
MQFWEKYIVKQIKMIKLLILYALFFNITIQTETTQSQEIPLTAAEQKKIIKLIEFSTKAILKTYGSLQKIENKLTEIALLIKKGSFSNPAISISQIMEILTANKMIINTLLQSQATLLSLEDPGMNLEYSYLFTEFCNAFIPYLNKQIKTGFKNKKPFDIKGFFANINKNKKRGNLQHLSKPSLIIGLKKTRLELKSLQNSVESIGLTWYNKIARTFDKNIVTPVNKYHLPTIFSYGTGVGILGLYSLWSYGYLIMNNEHVPGRIRDFIKNTLLNNNNGPIIRDRAGFPLLVNKHTSATTLASTDGQQTKIPDNASAFATTDFIIKDFMMQNQPLASLAAVYMLSSLYKTWQEDIYPKLLHKRDDLWNFLRGGEYRNTLQTKMTQFKPTVSFKDMVGLDEVKQEFTSIIQYIDNPEQLMRIDATPEKGWLLTGPTRTGKSFSVECLCGEIELAMQRKGLANTMKFFNISAALVNQYGIKAILDEIKENAPAVIFIDEIDLLGLSRVGNNQLLSEFLVSMQSSMNADPSKIVIVIAATNHPEHIDKALRQNGRFGKEIRFEYPARKYRIEYIIRELTNMALDITQFNPETLADKTNDVSFEALKSVIRNAMTRAWFFKKSLTQEFLEESIDTEIHNIMLFDRKDLPEKESRVIATHFAGRALASILLETHEQFDKVTIHARKTNVKDELAWDTLSKKDEQDHQVKIEYGALMTKQSHDSINVKNEITIINEATALMAGFAAEELLLGSCGFTCHSQSREQALQLIKKLIFGGINPASLSKTTREELMLKTYTIFKKCHEDASALLANHKDALIALVDELMKNRIMNDKEIQAVINKVENVSIIPEQITEQTSTEITEKTGTERIVDTSEPLNNNSETVLEQKEEQAKTEEEEEIFNEIATEEETTEQITDPSEPSTNDSETMLEQTEKQTNLKNATSFLDFNPIERYWTTFKEKIITVAKNVNNFMLLPLK